MPNTIRVISYGLGAIGRAAARGVLDHPHMEVVGAVDCDPALAGRDLGRVIGLRHRLGVPVHETATDLLKRARADAVIHCTTSKFPIAAKQFSEIARAGLHCVSSCEEALFPAYRHPQLAARLHRLCRRQKVAMVGTGVNPGFAMDTLAAVMTAVCQRVDSIRVRRVVDAGTRREALQRKVGAGLTASEFRDLAAAGKLGHAGLTESLVFLADALGWDLTRVTESIDPKLAPKRQRTEFLSVKKGRVTGIHQVAVGYRGRREVLRLDLQMYVGARQPRDEIVIDGEPPLRVAVDRGLPGDIATPAILVNCLPRLLAAAPGWHTMTSLGLPRYAG